MTEREIITEGLRKLLARMELVIIAAERRVRMDGLYLSHVTNRLQESRDALAFAVHDRDAIKDLIKENAEEKVSADLLQHHTYINGNGNLVIASVLHDILTEEQCKRALACVEDNITENEDGTFTVDYVQAEADYYKEGI